MSKGDRYMTQGPEGPKGVHANFQHATDVFVENYYRLAPRYKFLFHAFFELDKSVPTVGSLVGSKADEDISLLVKTSNLPAYTFDTTTKNAYNRKKIVYKQINYDPLTLTFHDDNAGIMNALWNAYYTYYSNDPDHDTDAMWKADNTWTGKRYGMDVDTPTRFFKRISLSTMSRQKYLKYDIWGVRIKSWKHGDVDYSEGNGIVENSMTIEFEGVTYDSGDVSYGSPDKFASTRYDKVPSPNTTGGGPGGGGGGNIPTIMNSVPEPNLLQGSGQFSSSVIGQLENYRNISLPGGVIPGGAIAGSSIVNQIGGIVGASFPINAATDSVAAAAKRLNSVGGSVQGLLAPSYTGDDPIIQARLGLPPDLPEF